MTSQSPRHIYGAASGVPAESPARAINPETGRLAGTLRLTPWANSLRYAAADAHPDVTYIPDALMNCGALSFRAIGVGALIYSYPVDRPGAQIQEEFTARENIGVGETE